MGSTATATATPPYHHHDHDSRSEPYSRMKSASRLAQSERVPHLSLGLITSSPKTKTSPQSLRSSGGSLPLRELLLLSPSPILRKRSKTRLTDRLEMADDAVLEAARPRRCKSKAAQMASPRNSRRSRRRSEIEIREDKDSGLVVEEIAKPRKRRSNSKKEKLSLVPCLPSPTTPIDDEYPGSLDRIGQLMNDLIMWRDVARSSLWFGLGSLFFFSSCFAKGINFSIFSAISQLGLLFLGASFVSDSICQRNGIEKKPDFMLKEDDILGAAKMMLPAANLAISKTRALFSGEPSMTLKVAPFFLLGAEYGHLITVWRLSMLAFFISFTIPKLYSCYSIQTNQKVECLKWWVLEAWGACSHKKIVAASAATAFWNLSSVKTRIFTAFITLVILRYCRQLMVKPLENVEAEAEQEHQQALVVPEAEAEAQGKQEQQQAAALIQDQQQQALVVAQL